jgi:hypothetical protein
MLQKIQVMEKIASFQTNAIQNITLDLSQVTWP